MKYHRCPFRDVIGVLLEQLTVSHAEEQTCFGVIYGVVVDIDAVGNGYDALAVEYGLLVARDDFGNRHVVTTLHHSLGNARGIDGGMTCGDEEQTNEISGFTGSADEIDLALGTSSSHSWRSIFEVMVVFPEPFGPAITMRTGRWVVCFIVFYLMAVAACRSSSK